MSRVKLTDTSHAAIVKMAEGSPGAVAAMVDILTSSSLYDPESAGGGLMSLLALDDLGVYGSKIWVLYSDICGKDVRKVAILMRSHQLGFIDGHVIYCLSDDYEVHHRGLSDKEWSDLESRVKKRIPSFI